MRLNLLPRFVRLVLGVTVSAVLCTETVLAEGENATVATFSSPISYQVYNILAAEIYVRQGALEQAALHYIAVAQQSKRPDLAKRAVELAQGGGDTALSKRALALWSELDPHSPEVRRYRIVSQIQAEQYDEAVKELAAIHAEAEKKTKGSGLDVVAGILSGERDINRAYEAFKRYVATVDSSARAQLALSEMAQDTDHFDEAISAARKAKQTGDKAQKERASRLIAEAYMSLQQPNKALEELGPVAKTSKDLDLQLSYGRMLIMTDRRSEATPVYQQLYAKRPSNVDILYTLGLLYLEQKQFDTAEPLIKKLQAVPERTADASYFLGQIHEGQKRNKEALQAYKQALTGTFAIESTNRVAVLLFASEGVDAARAWLQSQSSNAHSDAHKARLWMTEGRLLYESKRYADAVAVFDQALALNAENTDALYNRSLAKEKMGDFVAAEADLRAVLKLQPENATVLNALGYMVLNNSTERYAEAESLIRQANKLHPDDPAIMDSMGWVLFRTNKLDEAELWLRKAYGKLVDPEIASHLVEVLSARGKTAEAKTLLQDMLGKFPDDPHLIKLREKWVGL